MAKETIEVLYALMDKNGTYSKFAGTSICSMFENTKEKVRVHIFHDGSIKGENKRNFEILADRYGQEIILYNVRQLLPEVWEKAEKIKEEAVVDARYTEAALYRILAPQVLPESISRLIYIDVDTIVNVDIKKLWQEKIGKNGMAVVMEQDLMKHYGKRIVSLKPELVKLLEYWEGLGVKIEETFNTGVLLMDLDKIRPMGNLLLNGLRLALNCDVKNNFYDQNILNFYFAKDAAHLPWYYNIIQHWDKKFQKNVSEKIEGIYHYMGHSLMMDEEDLRDTIFYDYFIVTPWAKGKMICHIFNEVEKRYVYYMETQFWMMRKLISNLASKKLVLAASLLKEAQVLKLCQDSSDFKMKATHPLEITLPLFLRESEERRKEGCNTEKNIKPSVFPKGISYHSLGSDKNLNLNLPYDVDKYFYLFFVEDYMYVKIALEKAGLMEEGHYMNGNFLIESAIEGGALNPNKLIEKL